MSVPETFCAAAARADGESLIGTAAHCHFRLALEYRSPFGVSALDDSGLEPELRETLRGLTKQIPLTLIQLIKRDPRASGPLTLFAARITEQGSQLYRFMLDSYDQLSTIDFVALAQAEPEWAQPYRYETPVALICTHAKHDPCCGLHGLALFRDVRHQSDIEVWQSSHVGGDRFAANMILLHNSIYYGQVTPESFLAIAAATQRGALYPHGLRGRSLYAPVVQTAEVLLRQYLEEWQINALRLQGTLTTPEGVSHVTFRVDTALYTIKMITHTEIMERPLTCHGKTGVTRSFYDLQEIEQLTAS